MNWVSGEENTTIFPEHPVLQEKDEGGYYGTAESTEPDYDKVKSKPENNKF